MVMDQEGDRDQCCWKEALEGRSEGLEKVRLLRNEYSMTKAELWG